MRGRGLLRRTLTIPWCRALAVLGVWVIAMEAVQLPLLTAPGPASCCSVQLPLLTAPGPASCCCARHSADTKCQCRVCTHAREVESGKPVLKTCGSTDTAWAVVSVSRDPAFPVVTCAPQTVAAPPAIELRLASPPPDPLLEVPTPPPLANS